MAQFLVPGDIVLHERKKRIIVSSKTKGDLTRIIFKDLKGNQVMTTANRCDFLTVVNSDHVLKSDKITFDWNN